MHALVLTPYLRLEGMYIYVVIMLLYLPGIDMLMLSDIITHLQQISLLLQPQVP